MRKMNMRIKPHHLFWAVLLAGGCTIYTEGPGPQNPQPPPQGYTIQIVGGTYGQSCNAPYGNKTAQLAAACNGQTTCNYKVDYQILGDPAYGCAKDYIAEWRCGADPTVNRAVAPAEAGFGSILALGCPPPATQPVYVPPPPPPQQPPQMTPPVATIVVVAGTYGRVCNVPTGNRTESLARACNGRLECNYKIDMNLLGDPARGCQKDYMAQWRCGDDPRTYQAAVPAEAGVGLIITLTCNGHESAPPPPPPPPGGGIQVVSGSFGLTCNAQPGNKTKFLADACNNKNVCNYKIDYAIIGDPAYGCAKNYVAEWRCAGDPTVHRAEAPAEAGFGSIVTLSCP